MSDEESQIAPKSDKLTTGNSMQEEQNSEGTMPGKPKSHGQKPSSNRRRQADSKCHDEDATDEKGQLWSRWRLRLVDGMYG